VWGLFDGSAGLALGASARPGRGVRLTGAGQVGYGRRSSIASCKLWLERQPGRLVGWRMSAWYRVVSSGAVLRPRSTRPHLARATDNATDGSPEPAVARPWVGAARRWGGIRRSPTPVSAPGFSLSGGTGFGSYPGQGLGLFDGVRFLWKISPPATSELKWEGG
jgi:hypothetical protein